MTETHGGQSCRVHAQYRMDCAEYNALLARAAGHCEACGTPSEDAPRKMLYIDHDHRYGVSSVRGLLCSHCNTELGVLEKEANSGLLVDRHHRFGPYMRGSWHMQLVHWARSQDDLLGSPDAESQTLNESVLRFPTVRRVTTLVGIAPSIATRGLVHPRYTALQITASYGLGRASCAVVLRRSVGVALTLETVRVFDHGPSCASVAYPGFTEARDHLARLLSA